MVNWKTLATQAKAAYDNADKDELKRKAEEVKKATAGKGSLTDKARAAADVVTDAGKEKPAGKPAGDAAPEAAATKKPAATPEAPKAPKTKSDPA